MADLTKTAAALRPEYWTYFAGVAAKDGCALYAAVSEAAASDPALQDIAARSKPGQPPANMLFAAVHFLLLGGAEHPLRRFYPHLLRGGESVATDMDEAVALFRDFVRVEHAALAPLIAARVTNTNEVRRCSYLRCGFAEIASRAKRPIDQIELGPSAGLNLNWDRYAYRYDGARTLSSGSGGFFIDAEWRGEKPPPVPAEHPQVARRAGLELNKVDLASEEDRRWLVALVWPGNAARIARQKAALEIAADHPPPVIAGDALATLGPRLSEASPAHARVVDHTLVVYQWSQEMKDMLDAILREASMRAPVYRLHQDTVLPEDALSPRTPLRLWTYDRGERRDEELADAHHHGNWIEWKA